MITPAWNRSIEPLEPRIAPAGVTTIDLKQLDPEDGFKLDGVDRQDGVGWSVNDAGDVNGDGLNDIIVGAPIASSTGTGRTGAAFVIFGREEGFDPTLSLSALDGTNGFRISGLYDADQLGHAVDGIGDFNGDGLDDIIVSAPQSGEEGFRRGAVYIVFGKAGSFDAVLSVGSLNGTNGFKLTGIEDQNGAGYDAQGAGDMNGDGLADIVIGTAVVNGGGTSRGAAYVVFGQSSGLGPAMSLGSLDGRNGFELYGHADRDEAGRSVDGVGDVNGDGLSDIIIGAAGVNVTGSFSGAAYVVFGKAETFAPRLGVGELTPADGFRIMGAHAGDIAGFAVAGAGDVNGDGISDVIIGAPGASEGGYWRGAAYVVFGNANGFDSDVLLSTLDGTTGFRLSGVLDRDGAGSSVSAAGDVNGDGYGDVLITAVHEYTRGSNTGTAYLVHGKENFRERVDLAVLEGEGVKILSIGSVSGGSYVSGAGDLNHDGIDDILLGAPALNRLSSDPGPPICAAYVVFGAERTEAAQGVMSMAKNGKSASYTDWDGDRVVIKTSKGKLAASQFILSELNPETGGSHLLYADFSAATTGESFKKANITFSAKSTQNMGDSLADLVSFDARGTALGKVAIDGDLKEFDAASAKHLRVNSLGFSDAIDLHGDIGFTSTVEGVLGGLTARLDVTDATLSAQSFGTIKAHNFSGVSVHAAGTANPSKIAYALAIKAIQLSGSMIDSHILAGYDSDGKPVNADVQIGGVSVANQWVASDLVAGVTSGTDAIFGNGEDDEAVITGGNSIISKIAAVKIGRGVFGSDKSFDGYGFVAEEIGSITVNGEKIPLQTGPSNDTLAQVLGSNDVRVREISQRT